MHIRFLLELHKIHSRSRTRHKKKKITPPMRAGRLKRMFTYWATEEELFWANRKNRPESLDWTTGHDWDWWCTQATTNDIEDTLAKDLESLRRLARKYLKAELSEKIDQAVARRQQLALTGRLKTVIQSLLNKHRTVPNILAMDLSSGPTGNSKKIHRATSRGWRKLLQNPKDGIARRVGLEPDPHNNELQRVAEWEAMLDDPEKLVDILRADPDCHVPTDLVRAISQAMTGPVNRPVMEAEMTAAFATPFSREQFQDIIQRSHNGAGGVNGPHVPDLEVPAGGMH
jgi:hypothetical protein